MNERVEPRKKSPRAPTVALEEALERALKIYEKERLHSIPTEIAAKHMGYGNANNGSALQCLASLRYYGLLERPKDGVVAISKDVEAYRYAPNDTLKSAFLRRFLTAPPLFAELLDRVQGHMPSDDTLRYELLQRGFLPTTAALVASVFKRSVDFAGALNGESGAPSPAEEDPDQNGVTDPQPEERQPRQPTAEVAGAASLSSAIAPTPVPVHVPAPMPLFNEEQGHDRIPVRLPGGRRAWIVVPPALYEKDKARLKAQIDLLLTEDEDEP